MKTQEDSKRIGDYLDSWLRFMAERSDLPGFSVTVLKKGEVIFNEAYGYANLEKKEKLTSNHIFRIASHSKTFTATAIMQLQERGKLRIDDYAVQYIPWLKEHSDKRFQKITIRQLLSHSAGILRDGVNADYWAVEEPFPDEKNLQKQVLKSKLILDNNTKLKYSNIGYSLLGMIVSNVTSQPYSDYVIENIIKPLGLASTFPEYDEQLEDRLVTGYTRQELQKKRLPIAKQINTHAMSSATGLCSNGADTCKYFTAHKVGTGKLLDDESKKEMQRTQWYFDNQGRKEEYGLGFEIETIGDTRCIAHGGGFPGQLTSTLYDPQSDVAVCVLTNAIDSDVNSMSKGILKVIQKLIDKPDEKLLKFEGRFMSIWSVTDIIASGQKLFAGYAKAWSPFEYADELEWVSDTTLKIAKTSSFASVEENIEYTFNDLGIPKKINFAGATMLPEKEYLSMLDSQKQIEESSTSNE